MEINPNRPIKAASSQPCYQMPITLCITRLTHVITSQQQAPRKRGFPPVLIKVIILLLRPTAAIAMVIKNLLNVFTGAKKDGATPKFDKTAVIMEAAIK